MNDDKQVMNIFAQAYLLLAKASKLKPSKEGFLQVLEMLGEEGIQLCAEVADLGPEVVAQTMVEILLKKSALKAENGAKLQHLMLLKDMCPEGYLKQGGRCKPCEEKEKLLMKQSGGPIGLNGRRKLSNLGEGVNGKGTQENPVVLPTVYVEGKRRSFEPLRDLGGIFLSPAGIAGMIPFAKQVSRVVVNPVDYYNRIKSGINHIGKKIGKKLLGGYITRDRSLAKDLKPSEYGSFETSDASGFYNKPILLLGPSNVIGEIKPQTSGVHGISPAFKFAPTRTSAPINPTTRGQSKAWYDSDSIKNATPSRMSTGYMVEVPGSRRTFKNDYERDASITEFFGVDPYRLKGKGEYPIYGYDGNVVSVATDNNAGKLSGHLPYNPGKYTRVEPYDGITARSFDVALSDYKNPTFKDRLSVLRLYMNNPKGFRLLYWHNYDKNYGR